jgi:micrococcal nuclease
MSKETFDFKVISCRVIDGDSINVTIDLGVRCRWEGNLRLAGINCPEARGDERDAGKAVGEWVKTYINERVDEGYTVRIMSHEFDKFGRLLGDVYFWHPITARSTTPLSQILIEKGYAKEYNGDGPRPQFGQVEIKVIVEDIYGSY